MHYILYAVRKGAAVAITLEGATTERIHGMPIDLSQTDDEVLASLTVLVDEIRAWEHEKAQNDRSKS